MKKQPAWYLIKEEGRDEKKNKQTKDRNFMYVHVCYTCMFSKLINAKEFKIKGNKG